MSETPIPPLAHLPDLCLLALFRQLPPADQMSARNTCHRWSILVPAANRRHPRTFFALIFECPLDVAEIRLNDCLHGSHWKLQKLLQKEDSSPLVSIRSWTKWNTLQFNSLDADTVSQITATFPVVSGLQLFAFIKITIYNAHCVRCAAAAAAVAAPTPMPDLLVRLLEQWRPHLTNLNLNVDIWSLESKHSLGPSIDRLGAAINSLSALKHLSTNLKPFFPNVRLLTQLTEYNTDSTLSPSNIIMLRHCENQVNSPLRRISIGYYCDDVASLSPDLRQRVIRFGSIIYSSYKTICDHFRSLTSVGFNLSTITLRYFLTHASQLTELIYLYLCINFPTILPDDQPHRLLPQLKSVKLLVLFFNSAQSHRDLEQLNVPWTMPNVQVIMFEVYIPQRCTTCGISYRLTRNVNKVKHCLRQMIAPLKRGCAKLHTIKHDLDEELGTVEEILAEQQVA